MSCTTHASEDNLCYATGEGEVVPKSHQKKFCLGGKLAMCTRFPSDPALSMVREAADMTSHARPDEFEDELEEELEEAPAAFSVPVGRVDDEPNGTHEPYFEREVDFEDVPAVAKKTPARPVAEPAAHTLFAPSDPFEPYEPVKEDQPIVAGEDDFYFEDVSPEVERVAPASFAPRTPFPSVSPAKTGETVVIPPVGPRRKDTPAVTSQPTLAGQPLGAPGAPRPAMGNGFSGSPSDGHPSDRFNGTIPMTTDLAGSADSVYDPTVVLPVIRPPAVPQREEVTPKVRKPGGALPEPALSHKTAGAKAANGAAARKNVAGVDPNWLARHKASQSVLNQNAAAANGDAQGRGAGGAIPEPILRPAEIHGPVKPMLRQVGPVEAVLPSAADAETLNRPRTYLYVSMVTTLLSLLLICGGGAMVYHSLAASETEASLPVMVSPQAQEPLAALVVAPTESPEGTQIAPAPTAEVEATDAVVASDATTASPPAAGGESTPVTLDPLEPTEEASTIAPLESMAEPTYEPSVTASPPAPGGESTPVILGPLEPTEEVSTIAPLEPTAEPTSEPSATPTTRPTRTPTLTPTATAEDTATPSPAPTRTPTSSPTPRSTATATETATPENTATATRRATGTPTEETKATSTRAATATTTGKAAASAEVSTGTATVERTPAAMAASTSSPTPEETQEAEATSTPTATATESPTPTPTTVPAKATFEIYQIQQGDSLYSVALAYGLELSDIVAANPELEGALLSIGQEVKVPVASTAETPAEAPTDTPTPTATEPPTPTEAPAVTTPMRTVAIQSGDTLYEIASQNDISLDVLLQANPALNPQQLRIGQEINIPEPGATLAPLPTATPIPTATAPSPQIYVIQSGDSLLEIANQYDITLDELLEANPDVDPRRMAIGQEITIPLAGDSSTPAATAVATPAAPAAMPEHISAPSVGLDAAIVAIDTRKETQDGLELTRWDEPDGTAGFHSESSYPGQGGNIVISGAQNGNGEVFRRIVDFEKDADVVVEAGGESYTYSVDQVLILPNAQVTAEKQLQNERWLADTADERLTLISYWPYENATHLVIVVAKPVPAS